MYEPITAIIVIGAAIILGIAGFSSWYYLGAKHDNKAEEWCEDKIQDLTGMDIDLSPSTPEIKDTKVSEVPDVG